MGRYCLFAGDNYYPQGGIHDMEMTGNDLDKVISYYNQNVKMTRGFRTVSGYYDWGHVVDTLDMSTVAESTNADTMYRRNL